MTTYSVFQTYFGSLRLTPETVRRIKHISAFQAGRECDETLLPIRAVHAYAQALVECGYRVEDQ